MKSFLNKHKDPNAEKQSKPTETQGLAKEIKTFFGKGYTTYGTFEMANKQTALPNSVETEEAIKLKLSC